MKPFILLALCCSFFSSTATPLPFEFSDCDDPDVFKAVDTALKKYNGDQATGNQFALYMVMEAKRTAGPNTQFYVKYRIQETTCATEENKLWQDCDYKVPAEAKTGECTARVHLNNDEKTSNVSQDCKIFPAAPKVTLAEAPCLGCFHPISTDSSEVSEILKQAIEKFNGHSAEPALFKLVEIKEAKRQVVAGWNYIIKYEIEETNCSKDQFQDLTPECKPTSRGRVGKCDAKAYENLQAQIIDIASQFEDTVIPGIYAGCPKTIPKDSPELKELLKVSMEKYNSDSNDEFYYKGGEIEAATVQVGIHTPNGAFQFPLDMLIYILILLLIILQIILVSNCLVYCPNISRQRFRTELKIRQWSSSENTLSTTSPGHEGYHWRSTKSTLEFF
uniref:Kininogen 1 n=1 Tax=Strix occidentalis caurina TaxID=311401 RepID=A0A8D0EJW3_STROC